MLRACRLAESALINIERIDHPSDLPHVDPHEEVSEQYSINWLEHGTFSIVSGSRTWRVGSSELFLTVPGQVHQYIHEEVGHAPTDCCIAVSFKDSVFDDIRSSIGSARDRAPVVRSNNRHGYLKLRLLDHLTQGADSIALDLLGGELLDSMTDAQPRRLYRATQLSWYTHRIEAARNTLDEKFASQHTLSVLARNAGMSPFHFARVFRELVGVPPHRYLLRRRMVAAEQMLRQGASVTDTSFAVGFQSLSHFVNVFRQTFGASPSRLPRSISRRPVGRRMVPSEDAK
jgi:AraC family transcriptional regulator